MNDEQGRIHRPNATDEFYTDERCFILECWNQATDRAVSIARARVAPAVTTRWHRLDGIVERYLILSGSGRMEIEGLPAQTVGPGDLVYIPAGQGQRISNPGECDLLFLAICTPRFVPQAYQDVDPDPI